MFKDDPARLWHMVEAAKEAMAAVRGRARADLDRDCICPWGWGSVWRLSERQPPASVRRYATKIRKFRDTPRSSRPHPDRVSIMLKCC
jgi:hypothetical protein